MSSSIFNTLNFLNSIDPTPLTECPMDGTGPAGASISITASTGKEVSDMVRSLTGVDSYSDNDEPVVAAEPVMGDESMEPSVDVMNDPELEGYANAPTKDVIPKKQYDPDEYSNQENQPSGGDRFDGRNPRGNVAPRSIEENLMNEYIKFVGESK